MLLSDLVTPERVLVPLAAEAKNAAIAELAKHLVACSGGTYEDVVRAVLEREDVLSTGIGFGVAIPHGKSASMPALGLVCGISRVPIAYGAVDGEPVRLFFLIVGPEASAGQHVKVLSRIARLVRQDAVRERLLRARTPVEFHEALLAAEER
ncbi:MAG TPA: PTS sugar transporter subunit IIA [Gemmatimonadales bacterium]|nr:PTS sugar transporter subunit IIA [Gemmatimonadales bacterium]